MNSLSSKLLGESHNRQPPEFSGMLYKMGGSKGGRKNWKLRWFVIKDCIMYYYQDNSENSVLLGLMPLASAELYDLGADVTAAPIWEEQSNCATCAKPFGMALRRHHCRYCGKSLCDVDSSRRIAIPKFSFHTPVRVCNDCYVIAEIENNKMLKETKTNPVKRLSVLFSNVVQKKKEKHDLDINIDNNKFTLPSQPKQHMFALKNEDRELWLHAESQEEREQWITAIKNSVDKRSKSSQLSIIAEVEEKQQWEIEFQDVVMGKKIGTGSFGDVFRGKLWGTEVAIKTLKNVDIDFDTVMEDLRLEVKILSQLRHPNVVLYMGASTKPPNVCIVTEWCPRGSLYDLMMDADTFINCKMMIDMAIGIAQGMNYLHSLEQPIIHRDLKSYNILIDEGYNVKVADFGLSYGDANLSNQKESTHSPDQLESKNLPNDIFGTPEWMAPEVMEGLHYNEKIDVYSFGVLLTEILTRRKPFSDQFEITHYQDVFDAVLDNGAVPTIPKWCKTFIQPLVLSCLSRDSTTRLSFTDIILYLQEYSHLNGREFFVRFDFPRLMESLSSTDPKFQALAANEIASLAFSQRKRENVDVPDWYKQTEAEKKDNSNSTDFRLISDVDFSKMIDKLCLLFTVKYASVQLAACHALSSLLKLFVQSSALRVKYTAKILEHGVDKKLFRLLMKDNKQLCDGANVLLLTLALSSSSPTDFLDRFRSMDELHVFDTYLQCEIDNEDKRLHIMKKQSENILALDTHVRRMLEKNSK